MKFIAYYRVSTKRQGLDGYGMEGQRQAVQRYLTSLPDSELIDQYQEVESGANNERPQLLAAIELAKNSKATLIIAKLDRISRNASFLLALQDSGVAFVCCDMPSADRFSIGILALVAQRERELISQRTKAGLSIAKQKGVVLGNPRAADAWQKAVVSIRQRKTDFAQSAIKSIREIQETGVTKLCRIAQYMNQRGEKTARGGKWRATTVKRVLECA